MNRTRLSRIFPLCMLAGVYAWPLTEPPALTSTFGEFRSHHFHGGIDLTTYRKIGLPVLALEDGEVVRVRASGVGYGRAIYFRMTDGNTAVYAHLDDYAPDLAAWMASVQERSAQYEQDLYPEAGKFRYSRGDTIGYAGDSGAGPPHLHIEVRTGDTGLNPLRHGLPKEDPIPPRIRAVWLYPAGAEGRVDGRFEPVRIAASRRSPGNYSITRPVRVSGPIRVAVESQDRAPERSTPLGLYEVGAELDGELVYLARLDSIPWGDTREVKVLFDPVSRDRGSRRVYSLTPPASLRSGVVHRGSESWLFAPGAHPLRIWCEDGAGNRSTLELSLTWIDGADWPNDGHPSRPSVDRIDLEWSGDAVLTRLPSGRDGRVRIEPAWEEVGAGSEPGSRLWKVPDTYAGPFTAIWETEAEVGGESEVAAETRRVRRVRVAVVSPQSTGTLSSEDGTCTVHFAEDTVFERHPFTLEVDARDAAAPGVDWGERLAPVYRVAPDRVPLRGSIRVRLEIPPEAPLDRTGLFAVGSSGYSFVAGVASGTHVAEGTTRTIGSFTAVTDTVAPTIERGRVRYPRRNGVGTAEFEIRWPVADRGAGIGTRSFSLWVDGKQVPVTYDPDARSAVWRPHRPPSTGAHEYRLEAVDHLGNRTTRTGSFRRS